MAIFSNQATLTYNGSTTNSNVVFGEILDILSATKTSVEESYSPGALVTYAVSLRNTGATALNDLTLTDDLGGYPFGGTTLYPLSYEAGSVTLFIDGVLQGAPTVDAGPPLVFSGINLPAGGDAVLVYQARVTEYANPNVEGEIENTVTVTGAGLTTPVVATDTVAALSEPLLTISKSINPSQVVDNDRITYTFVIQNIGNQAVIATDNATVSDLFDPILSGLTVTFNGDTWTGGVQYTYDGATGLFTTLPGQITVPAAAFTQNPVTGAYTVTPGVSTLVVGGTI